MNTQLNNISRCFTSLAIAFFCFNNDCNSQEFRPLGIWKDFFPYEKVEEVQPTDGVVYARTKHAVFSYHSEINQLIRHSTVQGLSAANPSAIAVIPSSETNDNVIVIGYEDGNVDLMIDGQIFNMPDIKNSNLIGNKAVKNIFVDPPNAYLATSFGVVVINASDIEVSETWYIEGQQNLLGVSGVYKHNNKWVVATDNGVYEADLNHPFLTSSEAWNKWDDLPEDPSTQVSELNFTSNRIFAHLGNQFNGRLWYKENSQWSLLDGWPEEGDRLNGMDSRNDTLLIGLKHNVARYDENLNLIEETNELGSWIKVNDVEFGLEEETTIWIASEYGGLLRFVPNPNTNGLDNALFYPKGPENASARKIDCWNDNLWFATGGVDVIWDGLYNSEGVHGLVNQEWIDVNSLESENEVSGIRDMIDVSIDPLNANHVMFASWEEGIIEVLNGEMIEIYNKSNSTIQEANFGGGPRTGIGGLDYDINGNLWFTNSFTDTPLQVMLTSGDFIPMDLGEDLNIDQNIGGLKCTYDGRYIWALLPRGGGIVVYDNGGTIESLSDDNWRFLNTGDESGALPSNYVYCIEEDLDGEIWLGTASGPAIFYSSESLFNNDENTTASQILIQQDGNYQYLLETEVITTIKIDGGNRKWVGTNGSGVYVLSEDGQEITHHFTTSNSPLPDNNVLDMAINHRNGEVFIATENGTVSYLSEATNWDPEMGDIYVFPNPVDQFHIGPITIDGLAYQTTLHITDASGRVIAVEESLGGRATWDGLLDDGTPAPYGVYMVFAVDDDGSNSAMTKFAITR